MSTPKNAPYKLRQRRGEKHLRDGMLLWNSARGPMTTVHRKRRPHGKSAVRAAKEARRLARELA